MQRLDCFMLSLDLLRHPVVRPHPTVTCSARVFSSKHFSHSQVCIITQPRQTPIKKSSFQIFHSLESKRERTNEPFAMVFVFKRTCSPPCSAHHRASSFACSLRQSPERQRKFHFLVIEFVQARHRCCCCWAGLTKLLPRH